VKIVRVDFPWAFIEARQGHYDWSRADYIVRRLRRQALSVQAILSYTPSWAGGSMATPPSAPQFSAFARAFAHRYRKTVRYYELWNEPDLARYWTGSAAEYVHKILVPGSRAVKRAAPKARVVLGGPSTANIAWFERIFSEGGGRAFDIASFHDYSADQQILAHADLIRDFLREKGQPAKPIWLGEFGFEEPGEDDRGHAGLLTLVLSRRSAIAAASWYTLRDDYVMTCCPLQEVELSRYGLLTADDQPKLSYLTLQRLLRQR
jgi:hypothetical protein